jgi:hypothetical protein
MHENYLTVLIEGSRRDLADRLAYLADDLKRTADNLRRASNRDELRSAFNALGELQNSHTINNLCGRLAAYLTVLKEIAPGTKIEPLA